MTDTDLSKARTARDTGMARAENHPAAEQDKAVIDLAITYLTSQGKPFSVNEARELLPHVAGPLIGARFHAAAARGDIERAGDTLATHEEGHARRVSVWVKAGTNPPAKPKQSASLRRLTPAEEQTIRTGHWALESRTGIRTTADARQVIRDLLDVLGDLTGVNGSTDQLM